MEIKATGRTVDAMRIDALSRIVEACVTEGLKPPLSVHVLGHGSLHLRVDDDHPEQVDSWAEFLGLPAPDDHLIEGEFIDHGTRDGTWRGLNATVWCAVHDREQVARMSAVALLGA